MRELAHSVREEIAAVLGHECAERGLDRDEELNAHGRELDEPVDALGLGRAIGS